MAKISVTPELDEAAKELADTEKALGMDHPDTLSFDNLADVLDKQGDYEAAEELRRRVLARRSP